MFASSDGAAAAYDMRVFWITHFTSRNTSVADSIDSGEQSWNAGAHLLSVHTNLEEEGGGREEGLAGAGRRMGGGCHTGHCGIS